MAKLYDLSIIGSGNVAWHLSQALELAGHQIREVYSRTPEHAEELLGQLYHANHIFSLDFSESESDVFILAVSDDAIAEVAKEIVLPEDGILVHTSGSRDLSDLEFSACPNTGVFYPLQTFTKSKRVDFKQVPFLIEASNDESREVLHNLASSLSKNIQDTNSRDRLVIHIAAVFASNFTNYMLLEANNILNANDFSFDILKPLVAETINKSLQIGPIAAQTGPAARGDAHILDKHLDFLKDSEQGEIYQIISNYIMRRYNP